AIGDFDKDGKPEVVAVYYPTHTVSFWHYDATQASKFSWMRQGVDINGTLTQHCPVGSAGYTQGGGPPTVADFNGDGTPDVALAGGIGYAVLDGKKVVDSTVANAATLLWSASTTDCSSAATGSSIFDFTGSGSAEVLYSDEEHLRVYDGPTGNVLFSTCNTTGTLEEFPLVADVDNDGHADIVVVSNAYASGTAEYQCNDGTNIAQSGVRVFSDPNLAWVRTRSIWNEHPYHITNVNDDGTIPQHELPNWTQPGLNNFRQNKQPGGEFAAPDAIVSVAPTCASPFGLEATVRNIGEAALPAGVVVGFYAGTAPGGTKLGSLTTLLPLYPAESETLVLTLASPPAGVVAGTTPVYAVVDDTKTPHPGWHECRTDNDTSAGIDAVCHGTN
ncbi:MAG TPA: VCBS repeat-containing protein, partial [Polyangiaceae bacterium]